MRIIKLVPTRRIFNNIIFVYNIIDIKLDLRLGIVKWHESIGGWYTVSELYQLKNTMEFYAAPKYAVKAFGILIDEPVYE